MSPEELRKRNRERLEAKRAQLLANKDLLTPVKELSSNVEQLTKSMEQSGISEAADAIKQTVNTLKELSTAVKRADSKSVATVASQISQLASKIDGLDVSPQVTVEPQVDIPDYSKEFKSISKGLGDVVKAVNSQESTDNKSLEGEIKKVYRAINSLEFPIPNYVLPFKDTEGRATQVQLDASGNLPISASLSGADGAIVDGVDSGIEATVLDYTNSNPLAVRLTDTSGDYVTAGGGTQYAEGDTDASITGTAVMWEDSADTLRAVSSAKPLPVDLGANNDVTVTGTVTVDGSGVTQPVSASSLPLPSGASTAANQSTIIGHVDGIEGLLTTIDADTGNLPTIETNTDFGTVTGGGTETGALRVTLANNSTGVVSVDDNGGSLTVDGTVTANLSATDNAVLDSIDTSTASKYITGIGHGVKTVTTAGTDVVLAGSTACKKVTIQAQTDNTGLIAVGGSGVDATEATGTGIILYAGDSYEFDIDNLADVYIDSTVNGEGVRYTYFT